MNLLWLFGQVFSVYVKCRAALFCCFIAVVLLGRACYLSTFNKVDLQHKYYFIFSIFINSTDRFLECCCCCCCCHHFSSFIFPVWFLELLCSLHPLLLLEVRKKSRPRQLSHSTLNSFFIFRIQHKRSEHGAANGKCFCHFRFGLKFECGRLNCQHHCRHPNFAWLCAFLLKLFFCTEKSALSRWNALFVRNNIPFDFSLLRARFIAKKSRQFADSFESVSIEWRRRLISWIIERKAGNMKEKKGKNWIEFIHCM